jgi:hypothetical protein|tara:strand:+ start:1035 stop:1229 length:195 start_codon:yes stop_codon:yes gene_type:complete
MERLFPASFTHIFLAALTTMTLSCKSGNRSALMLDLVRAEEMFISCNTHQARLAVHYTGTLKNK